MFFPLQDHFISGVGSPVKAQDMVRTFPSSMEMSFGRASILGGIPLQNGKDKVSSECQSQFYGEKGYTTYSTALRYWVCFF